MYIVQVEETRKLIKIESNQLKTNSLQLNKLYVFYKNNKNDNKKIQWVQVEGLEEYLRNPESDAHGSPDKSMISSSNVPRTTARKKALTDELEGSKLTTRTSCRTRTKAVEGTGKTPATRTTRKRASQEASIQKMMEKDLQAEFEADLEQQSEVSENNELSSGNGLSKFPRNSYIFPYVCYLAEGLIIFLLLLFRT